MRRVLSCIRSVASAMPMLATAAFAQPTSDVLEEALLRSRLDDAVLTAFEEVVLTRARVVLGERVKNETWDWVLGTPAVRKSVAWALAVNPRHEQIVQLDRLLRLQDAAVRANPELAIACASAWCYGTDEAPQRIWQSWGAGRAIPSIAESFAWYVAHERKLCFDIRSVAWPMLAYTVLNDVPLAERRWVLERYGDADPTRLRAVFADVPYVAGGLDGKPATLANMVEHGGVCTVNTQFAMSVMRTLGFPATFAGGPGHCWPCWIERDGTRLRLHRANDLGNADGKLGQWAFPGQQHESDLRLLARALDHSRDGLRRADIASAIYERVRSGMRTAPGFLLRAAIRANPYSARAWRVAARALPAELDDETATRIVTLLPKLAGHPELAFECFEGAMRRMPSTKGVSFTAVASISPRIAAICRDAGRLDLAGLCRVLDAERLERGDRLKPAAAALDAVLREHRAAEQYEVFATAFPVYVRVLNKLGDDELRRGLRDLLAAVRSETTPSRQERCVLICLRALLATHNQRREANELWLEFLVRCRGEARLQDAGDVARTELCGGLGGGEFVDRAPKGAWLAGLRVTRGVWNGIQVVGSVQPIYSDGKTTTFGKVYGTARGTARELRAPSGSAVAGITVKVGGMVDGLSLVFATHGADGRMRMKTTEVCLSDWHGGTGGSPEQLLGGTGMPIAGIFGRAGADVDAIGLLVERDRKR